MSWGLLGLNGDRDDSDSPGGLLVTTPRGVHAGRVIIGSSFTAVANAWSAWVSLGTPSTDVLISDVLLINSSSARQGYVQFGSGPAGAQQPVGVWASSGLDAALLPGVPVLLPAGQETWARIAVSDTFGNPHSIQYWAQPVAVALGAKRSYADPSTLSTFTAGTFAAAPGWGGDLPVMSAGVLPETCRMIGAHIVANLVTSWDMHYRIKVSGQVVYDSTVDGRGSPFAVGPDLPWQPIVPAGAAVSISYSSGFGSSGSSFTCTPIFVSL